jgi:hypothetical protein
MLFNYQSFTGFDKNQFYGYPQYTPATTTLGRCLMAILESLSYWCFVGKAGLTEMIVRVEQLA